MKKKVWDITVKDNPNRVTMGENDEFYTTDTEAYLVFNLEDKDFMPQSAMITLENRNDGSLKSEEVEVVGSNITWEMPERYIEHSGNWQAQLVYEQMKGEVPEKYTSGVMTFTVNSHIRDKKRPSLVEIENWEKFIADGTELIETWEDMEALRQANYQELLDTGVLQTNINNKLEQLEEEYAPKLTEVTTQLAHKVGGGKKAELEDMSTSVLNAIEGGEGTSFDLLSKPQRGSVYPETTTFVKTGKNLFNKNEVTIDYYIDGNGRVQNLTNYITTDFIPVEPEMTISISHLGTLVFYGKNKEFISGHGSGDGIKEFTVPEGVYFIRGSHVRTVLETLQIEIGEPSSYEPYKIELSNDIEVLPIHLEENLHDFIYNRESMNMLHTNVFLKHKDNLENVILKNNELKLLDSTNAPAKVQIVVNEDIEELKIKVVGKNLFNGEWEVGYPPYPLDGDNLIRSSATGTSYWFRVLPNMDMSLTGGNRTIWQFKDKEEINHYRMDSQTVRTPEDAYWGRVYYKNGMSGNVEDEVQVEFGFPTGHQKYREYELILNDLKSGDVLIQDDYLNWFNHDFLHPVDGIDLLHVFDDSLVSVTSSNQSENAVIVEVDYPKRTIGSENKTGIYGVRYNINDSNPSAERLYDSVGLRSNYAIGNEMAQNGRNDFDNVYPYSEMKLCNINIVDGNKILTYEGEQSFARDGSNGDVFVEVPRFFSREYVEDDWKYVLISDKEQMGLTLDSMFIDGDKEIDKYYIGVYEADVNNDGMISHSETYPLVQKTFEEYEDYAKQRGEGYGEFDWRVMGGLQRLFIVEHATRNSSSLMEGFTNLAYWGDHRKAIETVQNSNEITVQLYGSSTLYFVGMNVGISNNQAMNNRKIISMETTPNNELKITFDGSPLNIVEGDTQIYGIPQPNGEADSIDYHTGRLKDRLSDLSPMKYRHIENLWGNTWTNVSGLYMKNLEYYFVESSDKYSEAYFGEYKKLSYKAPLQGEYPSRNKGFIKKMGEDNFNNISLPVEVIPDSPDSYYTDGFYSFDVEDAVYIPVYGGGWDHPWSGMYNIRFWSKEVGVWLYGGRLIYRKYAR